MYYILNWFSKILHILDKLSNIWVGFINNKNHRFKKLGTFTLPPHFLKQKSLKSQKLYGGNKIKFCIQVSDI